MLLATGSEESTEIDSLSILPSAFSCGESYLPNRLCHNIYLTLTSQPPHTTRTENHTLFAEEHRLKYAYWRVLLNSHDNRAYQMSRALDHSGLVVKMLKVASLLR